MRYLLLLVSLLIAVLSLGWTVGVVGHLVLIVPAAVTLWYLDATTRPLRSCPHCDKGRTWDNTGTHFGEYCNGGLLGMGSCGATGKRLYWGARLLRLVGAGHTLRNLPESMRGNDEN